MSAVESSGETVEDGGGWIAAILILALISLHIGLSITSKFLVQLITLSWVLLALVHGLSTLGLVRRRKGVDRALCAAPLLWWVVFYMPFDLAVRDADHLGVEVSPVLYGLEYQRVRRRDYEGAPIGYEYDISPVKARWALVLEVPSAQAIRTPLFDDPYTPFLIGPKPGEIDRGE